MHEIEISIRFGIIIVISKAKLIKNIENTKNMTQLSQES